MPGGKKKKKGKMLCSVIRVLDMDVAPIPKAVPKILGLFPLTSVSLPSEGGLPSIPMVYLNISLCYGALEK